MKTVSIVLLSSFAIVTAAISAVPDPVTNFKTEYAIATGDKILKLETDVNGDGKNEILLCLKSDFEKDKEDHEPVAWTLYIAGNTSPVTYSKSAGTETKPGELSVDDLPQIDHERCFVGQIAELGKRGIVTMRHDNPREGPTINVIYAYTIEGDRLKKKELVRYEDSATPHALFAKYLADGKRTVMTPVEIAQ